MMKKHLKEFQGGETIYVRKLIRGYSAFFTCIFIKFEGGTVYIKKVSCEPKWQSSAVANEFKSIPENCCLKHSNGQYVWFNSKGELQYCEPNKPWVPTKIRVVVTYEYPLNNGEYPANIHTPEEKLAFDKKLCEEQGVFKKGFGKPIKTIWDLK